MADFKSTYASNRIVGCRQTGFWGFLPWGHQGVCNTMVMDWFRRIHAGRSTWLAYKNKQTQATAAREDVPWGKKRDRWMHLQATGEYSKDKRFGFTARPHFLEQGGADGSNLLLSLPFDGTMTPIGCEQAVSTILAYAPSELDADIFFLLSVHGAKGGHSMGVHLATRRYSEVRVEDEFVAVVDPRLAVSPDDFHFFDPNVGEYTVERSIAGEFLSALMSERYADCVTTCSVVRIPVWWGRGTAGAPHLYPNPY